MNAMTNVNTGGAVAVPGCDPFAAYGQEAASGGGDFLKFSKGEWLKGQSDEEVTLQSRMAVNMEELSIGWIRWADKKPVERKMGLLASGFRPETRDALGHDDQNEWEKDKDGKPVDPWSFTNELPVADPETGEQMIMSMSSKGGIGAIGNLCKAFSRERHGKDGKTPVIELGRDSYKHKEYGKTYVPLLPLVAWIDSGSVPEPAATADEPEEKPSSKTKF